MFYCHLIYKDKSTCNVYHLFLYISFFLYVRLTHREICEGYLFRMKEAIATCKTPTPTPPLSLPLPQTDQAQLPPLPSLLQPCSLALSIFFMCMEIGLTNALIPLMNLFMANIQALFQPGLDTILLGGKTFTAYQMGTSTLVHHC